MVVRDAENDRRRVRRFGTCAHHRQQAQFARQLQVHHVAEVRLQHIRREIGEDAVELPLGRMSDHGDARHAAAGRCRKARGD